MMQADTQSYKIPGFVEKASRAGCSQVFIGLESLNENNLKQAGKSQNKTVHFRELIEAYHQAGIATHMAYIIGFPFDTVESVRADMAKLRELGSEQASFFMLTPLPGSADYAGMRRDGTILNQDLNDYDSFHETFRHKNMPGGSRTRAGHDIHRIFLCHNLAAENGKNTGDGKIFQPVKFINNQKNLSSRLLCQQSRQPYRIFQRRVTGPAA
jgi:hypothetical protein